MENTEVLANGMVNQNELNIIQKKKIVYGCDICEKTFNSIKKLKMHKITHSIDNTFQCEYCEMIFAEESKLFKHEKIHLIELHRCDL